MKKSKKEEKSEKYLKNKYNFKNNQKKGQNAEKEDISYAVITKIR